jgi:hypothetical protein
VAIAPSWGSTKASFDGQTQTVEITFDEGETQTNTTTEIEVRPLFERLDRTTIMLTA